MSMYMHYNYVFHKHFLHGSHVQYMHTVNGGTLYTLYTYISNMETSTAPMNSLN